MARESGVRGEGEGLGVGLGVRVLVTGVLPEAHRQQRQGRAEEVGPEAHEGERDADHHADLGVIREGGDN